MHVHVDHKTNTQQEFDSINTPIFCMNTHFMYYKWRNGNLLDLWQEAKKKWRLS